MPRVLLLTGGPGPDGPVRQAVQATAALAGRLSVTRVHLGEPGDPNGSLMSEPPGTLGTLVRGFADVSGHAAYLKLVRSLAPDLIHAVGRLANRAAQLERRPTVA